MRHLSMNLKEKANDVVTRVDWAGIKLFNTLYCFAQRLWSSADEIWGENSATIKLANVPV
jgi:hypothetical protein